MKQISFVFVLQENVHNLFKKVSAEDPANQIGVFRSNDCLEKLDNFNVCLNGVKSSTLDYLLLDVILYEHSFQLKRHLSIVSHQTFKQLQNENSTLIQRSSKQFLFLFSDLFLIANQISILDKSLFHAFFVRAVFVVLFGFKRKIVCLKEIQKDGQYIHQYYFL